MRLVRAACSAGLPKSRSPTASRARSPGTAPRTSERRPAPGALAADPHLDVRDRRAMRPALDVRVVVGRAVACRRGQIDAARGPPAGADLGLARLLDDALERPRIDAPG